MTLSHQLLFLRYARRPAHEKYKLQNRNLNQTSSCEELQRDTRVCSVLSLHLVLWDSVCAQDPLSLMACLDSFVTFLMQTLEYLCPATHVMISSPQQSTTLNEFAGALRAENSSAMLPARKGGVALQGQSVSTEDITAVIEKRLFVGHVPVTTSEQEVFEVFSSFGTVTEVRVLGTKGIAFVRFETWAAAHRALLELDGPALRVEMSYRMMCNSFRQPETSTSTTTNTWNTSTGTTVTLHGHSDHPNQWTPPSARHQATSACWTQRHHTDDCRVLCRTYWKRARRGLFQGARCCPRFCRQSARGRFRTGTC